MFPNEHGGNYFRCYKSTSAWRRRNPTGNLNPINTNLFRRSYYRNALQILQNYFLLLAIARRIYSFLLFSRGISVITTSNIDFNSFVRLIDWRRGLGGEDGRGPYSQLSNFQRFNLRSVYLSVEQKNRSMEYVNYQSDLSERFAITRT